MKIRPTFEKTVELAPEEVRERLRSLQNDTVRCNASVLTSYAVLRIPEADMHYWSPQMNVEWLPHEEELGTRIRGRFGPRPSVWTLFAGFYLLSIFVGIMGGIFGLAQKQLGMPAWALWAVPVAAVCLGLSYSIALSGQKLGHDQMDQLQDLLDETIGSTSDPQ